MYYVYSSEEPQPGMEFGYTEPEYTIKSIDVLYQEKDGTPTIIYTIVIGGINYDEFKQLTDGESKLRQTMKESIEQNLGISITIIQFRLFEGSLGIEIEYRAVDAENDSVLVDYGSDEDKLNNSLIAVSSTTVTSIATIVDESTSLGDVNGDFKVNAADVVTLASYLARIPEYVNMFDNDPSYHERANVIRQDGTPANAADLSHIASVLAKIPGFKIEEKTGENDED